MKGFFIVSNNKLELIERFLCYIYVVIYVIIDKREILYFLENYILNSSRYWLRLTTVFDNFCIKLTYTSGVPNNCHLENGKQFSSNICT